MLPSSIAFFSLDGCLAVVLKVYFLYHFLSILLSGVPAPFLGISRSHLRGGGSAQYMHIYASAAA